VHKAYPERAEKVLHSIAACHGGKLNDSRWGARMRGEGELATSIGQLFKVSVRKYMPDVSMPELRLDLFAPQRGRQLDLF